MSQRLVDTAAAARAKQAGGVKNRIKPVATPLSLALPTAAELKLTSSLEQFLATACPLEGAADRKNREEVVLLLHRVFATWVKELSVKKGIFPDEASAEAAGGRLHISGSFRTSVAGPGDDIDCICVAPKHITAEDFFESLPGKLKAEPSVEKVHLIPSAAIPIMDLVVKGISIDLLFARVDMHAIPRDFDVLDDSVLRGVGRSDALSLNGPRVTELLIKLVPRFDTYKLVLRYIRTWAKRRGIYSNKAGFLGGVNYSILVAYICQLYPRASASAALFHFFRVFSTWAWPAPVMIAQPYTDSSIAVQDLSVFDPQNDEKDRTAVMPILTPAFPSSNSAYNVTWTSLAVMHREFCRGYELMRDIMAEHKLSEDGAIPAQRWAAVVRPSEFFVEFDHYVSIKIWVDCAPVPAEAEQGEGDEEYQAEEAFSQDAELMAGSFDSWKGYVESRMRKLVEWMQHERMPLAYTVYHPKPVEGTVTVPVLGTEDAQTGEAAEHMSVPCATFYVGVAEDYSNMRKGNLIDMRSSVTYFKDETRDIFARQGRLHAGMHMQEQGHSWEELPEDVFAPHDKAWGRQQRERVALVRTYTAAPSWRLHSVTSQTVMTRNVSGLMGFLGNGFGVQAAKEWQRAPLPVHPPLGRDVVAEAQAALQKRAASGSAKQGGMGGLPGLAPASAARAARVLGTAQGSGAVGAWMGAAAGAAATGAALATRATDSSPATGTAADLSNGEQVAVGGGKRARGGAGGGQGGAQDSGRHVAPHLAGKRRAIVAIAM